MANIETVSIFKCDVGFNLYDASAKNNVQMRCPHCQCLGTFQPAVRHFLGYAKAKHPSQGEGHDTYEAHIRICPNLSCKGLVFTVTELTDDGVKVHCFPPELLESNSENLPESLKQTLKEAILCHSQGAYRASAMMVRRLLEELCHDCGATGTNLHTRLKSLREQITMPQDLFDAMEELKALGNDAAHIEARAFAAVEEEESQLSIELAQEILKARYQHKSLVERLRSRKNQ